MFRKLSRYCSDSLRPFLDDDVAGATIVSTKIDRALFNCNARELAPLVKKGREFSGRRKGINLLTKAIDGALDRLGTNASTERLSAMSEIIRS